MHPPFILLINPGIYDFAAYDLWTRPVGLLSIASVLKKRGCEVHLLDCLDSHHPAMKDRVKAAKIKHRSYGQGELLKNPLQKPECLRLIPRNYSSYGMPPDIFQEQLKSMPKPDAVLVGSMMTYWYPAVQAAIKMVKEVFPEVPVLLADIYATLCRGHAEKNSGADLVVPGPFAGPAVQFLENIIKRPLLPAQDCSFPELACDLLSSKKVIPLLSSLGCPLKCPYCASKLLCPDFKQREPMALVRDIEQWHSTEGTTDFAFYDDALLIHPETHIIPLLEGVIEKKLPVRFHVPNGLHVRSIDVLLAGLMKLAGFKTLRLGLETADPLLQSATGNKASRDDLTRAAAALKAAGYTSSDVGVYILAGLPGQTVQSIRQSIAFVLDHGLRPYLTEYSPIPGTAFWPQAVAASPFPIAEEPLFHNNTLLPCRRDDFTTEDLETLKRETRKTGRNA